MNGKRKLNVGMVGLVPGRLRNCIPIGSRVRDEVELLLDSDFFSSAPFDRVGVIIRVGQRTDLTPEYEPIYQGELPIAVEVSMGTIRKAKDDELARIIRRALLEALLGIAEKYRLPNNRLLTEKQKDLEDELPSTQSDALDKYLH